MSAKRQKQTFCDLEVMFAQERTCAVQLAMSVTPIAEHVTYWIATDAGAILAGVVELIRNKMA